MSLGELLRRTIELFALVDPVGAIPIFIAITAGWPRPLRRKTAFTACGTMCGVLLLFAFAGSYILTFFGISIPAFTLAGGLLIGALAASMLQASESRIKQTPEEKTEAAGDPGRHLKGMVPLAVPLLSGPAARSNILIRAHATEYGINGPMHLVPPILIVTMITLVTFRLAAPIARLLGQAGINVVTRLMGLLLLALSVQLVADGCQGLFPHLFR